MIDKQQVMQLVQQFGDQSKAEEAERELPDEVDTERDEGLLQKFGVDPGNIPGLGGIAKNLPF